jgi:hypothetical protein
MNDKVALEQQLFSWEEWDCVDEGVYVFNGITLREDIGEWERGHQFSHAIVNYTDSTVCFRTTEDDEVGHTYHLFLSVGPKVLDDPSLDEKDDDTIPCPAPEEDVAVKAAQNLSHEALLEAARNGAELGTDDEH